jgi:hypothetical protein
MFYKEHKTVPEIADQFGTSADNIGHILKRHGAEWIKNNFT